MLYEKPTLFSSVPAMDYLFQKDTISSQMISGFRKTSEISAADTGSEPGPIMEDLHRLVGSKDYFIVTSNGEDHFAPAGFDRDKVFEMEGRLTQSRCQNECGADPYENRNEILKMAETEKDGKIPSERIPRCSCCGGPVTVNMADSNAFFQTEQFQKKMQDYQNFIKKYHGKKLVILELGVGWRNRMIKEPFMNLAASEPYPFRNCRKVYRDRRRYWRGAERDLPMRPIIIKNTPQEIRKLSDP